MSTPSFHAANRAADAVRCTFQPSNGGFHDRCRETAVWAEPANSQSFFREKRCQRHYDLDVKTYERRLARGAYADRWRIDRLAPYDAEVERDAVITEVMAAEAERRDTFWAAVEAAAKDRDLTALRDLAQRGPRVLG